MSDASARYPAATPCMGVAAIADRLDVPTATVSKWVRRYPPDSAHPFPHPDVVVGDVLGWDHDRIDEIRQWRAAMPGRGAGGGRPRGGARVDALRRAAGEVDVTPGMAADLLGEWVRSGAPLDALADHAVEEWPELGTPEQVREMVSLLRLELGE